MGMEAEEGDVLRKLGEKSKKCKKNEPDALQELSGCRDAVQKTAEDSVKMNKEDKKKNKKMNYELCGDAANENGIVEVDIYKKMEKDKKKKLEVDKNEKQLEKERKKDKRINSGGDAAANKEASSEKDHVGGEENRSLQSDAANEKVHVEVNSNGKMEKDKKKKKRLAVDENEKQFEKARKKDKRTNSDEDATETEEALNEKTRVVEGEKNMSLQSDDGKGSEYDTETESRKEKKKGHKKSKDGDGIDTVPSLMEDGELENDKVVKGQKIFEKEDTTEMNNAEEGSKKEKKRKEKRDKDIEEKEGEKNSTTDGDIAEMKNPGGGNKKKKKKRDKNGKVELKKSTKDGEEVEMKEKKTIVQGKEVRKEKNKKRKRDEGSEVEANKKTAKGEEVVYTTGTSKFAKSEGRSKKVSFSDHVDVFPSLQSFSDHVDVFPSLQVSRIQNKDNDEEEDSLVRGKRFSKEEDELIKEAFTNYIKEHGWDEDNGLDIILNIKNKVKEHPEVKNCWKEIASALPWRPYQSVYCRAHILFQGGKRGWTPEDEEKVRNFHAEHGSDWKTLADGLGKHRSHVKDKWRRIKLTNLKSGHWSQEEYEKLFNLVNMDLRMKASEEKQSKHGMLRDNICWGAISDKLSTRLNATCCRKWYKQLTSSMVEEGLWDDVDDYRMLDALYSLDACCMEDVDWEDLLEHRSGEVCRKRWYQMVKHIGGNVTSRLWIKLRFWRRGIVRIWLKQEMLMLARLQLTDLALKFNIYIYRIWF